MNYLSQIKTLQSYKLLQKEFSEGNIGGAYLFYCPDGLTAKVFLQEIAKLIENFGKADNKSDIKIDANTHPDVLVYPKNKNFVVEDALDIYDKVQVKPILSDYKVFIINEIDNSTQQAQNKMLKIIEEPPLNVVFLMSCCSTEKVLGTIKSRSQMIEIGRMDKNVINNLLSCDEKTKQIALGIGDGYLGKTIDVASNSEFLANYENCLNLVKNLKKSDQIPTFCGFFNKNKDIFYLYLNLLNVFFRDILMVRVGCDNLVKNIIAIEDFKQLANEFSVDALLEILKRLDLAKLKMDSNVNLVSLADNLLLDILEVKFLCK